MRSFVSSILLASLACSLSSATWEANATSARSLEEMDDQANVVTAQICGMDIVGHDVGTAPGSNPDYCSISCYMLYRQETNAATWTNYQGGTCFCKKVDAEGKLWQFLSPNAGAMSLVKGRPMKGRAEYVVFMWGQVDLPGNDIGNVQVKNYGECSDECLKWDRCFAHTYSTAARAG